MVLLFTAAACQPTCSPPAATPATSPSPTPSPSSSPVAAASPSPSPSAPASPVGPALAITSLPFHGGEVGIKYLPISLGASGGKPPYQWSITDGTFPPGLTLSTGGSVSGTNSAGGRFDFTVHVADSAGAVANTGSSVQVYSPLVTAAYCAGQCSVEEGCVTACGVFGGASGGLGPYQYSTTAGAAPPGMGLNGLALTGPFPAPGPVGAYNLTVVVTDQYGATGTVSANWYVFPHITFPGGAIGPPGPNCSWLGCTIQMGYSGGTPGGAVNVAIAAFQITSQCPTPPCGQPPAPTITASNGIVTFTVPSPRGTPGYGTSGYSGSLVVVLTDSSPCGSGNCNTGQVRISIIVSSG